MILYDLARKLNHRRKAVIREKQNRFVSPVRRIERVCTNERVCAMTFDDGPMNLPANPDVGGGEPLTRILADALLAHDFRATFDVVGDTSENYPDAAGEMGRFYWGGLRYDHYPRLNEDKQGGALHCQELISYLLEHGFELSNHGYRHRLFGFSPVYRKRKPMNGAAEVEEDLRLLDELLSDRYGYRLRLSRPPHYIDHIRGGFNAYDIYELMDYQYMAASFDGGGWLPKPDYSRAVEAMVAPVREKLAQNADFFCGQIIFQKDGYDMNGQTPVASALPEQLRLLAQHGYRVVPVGELLRLSPFADLPESDPCFDAARALAEAGVPIAFRMNDIKPDGPFLWGQLCMMLCPRDARLLRIRARMNGKRRLGRLGTKHPYAGAIFWADGLGIVREPDAPVTGEDFAALCAVAGRDIPPMKSGYTRREGILAVSKLLESEQR